MYPGRQLDRPAVLWLHLSLEDNRLLDFWLVGCCSDPRTVASTPRSIVLRPRNSPSSLLVQHSKWSRNYAKTLVNILDNSATLHIIAHWRKLFSFYTCPCEPVFFLTFISRTGFEKRDILLMILDRWIRCNWD